MKRTHGGYTEEDVLRPSEIREVNKRAKIKGKTVNYTFARITGMGKRLRCVGASYRG